jgi:hypothetical protein
MSRGGTDNLKNSTMKKIAFIMLVLLSLILSSCCSNKTACNAKYNTWYCGYERPQAPRAMFDF